MAPIATISLPPKSRFLTSPEWGLFATGVSGDESPSIQASRPDRESEASLRFETKQLASSVWRIKGASEKEAPSNPIRFLADLDTTRAQMQSSRGWRGIGVDTVGNPLVIDGRGDLCRIVSHRNHGQQNKPSVSNRTDTTKDWPPKRISQTEWYRSVRNGVLASSFHRYSPRNGGSGEPLAKDEQHTDC